MFTSDYGFITDYLAEILKELRKEDHTHDYQQYFELSDSITKRDRDSISKTYSGLMKVIHPHGEISEAESRELLEFAIECRKRVKLQLMKMDETFGEDVKFVYAVKGSGQERDVETLEIVEHFGQREKVKEAAATPVSTEAAVPKSKPQLAAGQKIIRDNQTGITYEDLFGAYLEGATDIKIVDPYIRLPYQMKNFMEFARLVAVSKPVDKEVRLHLRTYNDEEHLQFSHETFKEMSESLISQGIVFKYELDPNVHDRSITLNNGWKIVLGRGLDIYQRTSGRWDLGEFDQSKRQCKGCEITFVKD
jgi:ATP-dependent Lon protease